MENIVEIKDLNFSYESGNPILEKVNLTIRRGQSGCIVGPNGGGKSTLLKLLLGLLQPVSGTVRLFGLPPVAARRRIGYMPQYHQLDASFPITVAEVALMGRIGGTSVRRFTAADREGAAAALAEMGIAALADRTFASLSGGQRQRVLIARALA